MFVPLFLFVSVCACYVKVVTVQLSAFLKLCFSGKHTQGAHTTHINLETYALCSLLCFLPYITNEAVLS